MFYIMISYGANHPHLTHLQECYFWTDTALQSVKIVTEHSLLAKNKMSNLLPFGFMDTPQLERQFGPKRICGTLPRIFARIRNFGGLLSVVQTRDSVHILSLFKRCCFI